MDASNPTTTIRDGASAVLVDAQYWPIVFATWFDEPSETAVVRYFEVNDKLLARARANREKFILVTDTGPTKRPSAKARKMIADKTNAQPSDAPQLTIASFIVVENALLRGVVTALTWILPTMKDSVSVGSVAEAVERSLAVLETHGITPPTGLSAARYRRPTL